MCWGSSNFIGGVGRSDLGYLTFSVQNNPKIRSKCFVTIALNGKDLYDVTIWKRVNGDAKIFSKGEDLYFDMLEDFIFGVLG